MSALAQFLALAAIDVAGLFAIWFVLRARVRRSLELDSLLAGVREEARALITELNQTADRNVSLVEDRMEGLRELLDETDRRIGVAKRELASRAAEREVYARLNKRRPIVPGGDAPLPPAPAPGSEAARDAQPAIAAEAALRASAPPSADPSSPGAAPGSGLPGAREPSALPEVTVSREPVQAAKSPRERAIELHRSGFSAQIIAARIGATVAEVELMIEMEEMRPAPR